MRSHHPYARHRLVQDAIVADRPMFEAIVADLRLDVIRNAEISGVAIDQSTIRAWVTRTGARPGWSAVVVEAQAGYRFVPLGDQIAGAVARLGIVPRWIQILAGVIR